MLLVKPSQSGLTYLRSFYEVKCCPATAHADVIGQIIAGRGRAGDQYKYVKWFGVPWSLQSDGSPWPMTLTEIIPWEFHEHTALPADADPLAVLRDLIFLRDLCKISDDPVYRQRRSHNLLLARRLIE